MACWVRKYSSPLVAPSKLLTRLKNTDHFGVVLWKRTTAAHTQQSAVTLQRVEGSARAEVMRDPTAVFLQGFS